MSAVSPSISPMFVRAGWFSGRKVAVDPDVPVKHPSYAVLGELGGLYLASPAPFISSVAFRYVYDAKPYVNRWEAVLATSMVGIAEQDGGHAEFYMTERGQVIGCSLVHDAFWLVGNTFQEAFEAIGKAQRSRPMLLPEEHEVTLYGVTFRRGDDGLLGPAELC